MQQHSLSRKRDRMDAVEFRNPAVADGAAMWDLVRHDAALDTNSCYAYLLLCRHHAATCVVAHEGHALAGFVSAYIPPRQPDVLFVWQIVVNPLFRQRGLGKRLLQHAFELPACAALRYIEATVSPSNRASRRMFRSFADEMSAEMRILAGFGREDFPSQNHEDEPLVRIGPLEPTDADFSGS
jgi:L-2,4-diaminobutyric acid acetyltransferase